MSKKSVVLCLCILLSIFVVFSPSGLNLDRVVRAAPPPNSPYEGLGDNIDVFDFARNDSILFTDGLNGTSFSYLGAWFPPPDYRGYRLHTSVTDLRRTEDPVPNGDFDQYDEPGSYWNLTESKAGIVQSIDNVTGGNPDSCLDVMLKYGNVPNIAYAYIDNPFNYTSSIAPDALTLHFDIRYSADISVATWLSVKVAIEYQATEVGSWSNTTANYHPTEWDSISFPTAPVNGSVLLRITIQKQGGGNANVKGHVYFDNFRYVIGTDSKPSEIGLTLNDVAVSDSVGNTGEVDIYANPNLKEQALLANCWNTTQAFQFVSPTYTDISFNYEYSMYVKSENPGAASTDFSAVADQVPTWNVNYTIPSGRPPSGHTGYSYGLYFHDDWSLIEVRNTTDDLVPTTQYDYNTTTRFFKLKEDIALEGDTFRAITSSLNHVLEIHPQKSSTGTGPWINLSSGDYCVKGDWLRILTILRPIGPSNNSGEVSVYYPNGSLWNRDSSPTFDSNENTITSTAWLINQIDSNNAGSEWQIAVTFDNNTQCGMRAHYFSIVIETKGMKIEPDPNSQVLWGQSVFVNVTWQNNDTNVYIPDGTARIRYVDRNLQTRYENMIANGQGGYSLDFSTILMSPDQFAEFYVELYRYGYENITGTQLTLTINLVNDINYDMIKPTLNTGPDEWTAETTSDDGYTSSVHFYDPYEAAYVQNGSGPWAGFVRVNYTRYHDTGGPWQYFSEGSFEINATSQTVFFKYDASYSGVQRVKYEVTMRIEGAAWDYEQQNFTIIIRIVQIATDLDANRTNIDYPPSGDGWTQYNNNTDVYEVRLYWDEVFNITVFYHFAENDTGITGATAHLLFGASKRTLNPLTNGYYSYLLDTDDVGIGTTDLFVNASFPSFAAQTIQIRLIVEARKTELIKDYLGSVVDLPYDDDFTVFFTFSDTVTGVSVPITDATVLIEGYSTNNYTINNNGDGTYTAIFWGNITETTYFVTVTFSRTNSTSQSKYFEITVRPMHTSSFGLADSVSVPWGQNVTINLSYNDTDHSDIAIYAASLSFVSTNGFFNSSLEIYGSDYWILSNPDGSYTLILNTTRVAEGMQPFTLIITFSKNHFDESEVYVSFQIRDNLTVLQRQSLDPGTTVPWGDYLTIVFTYSNLDAGSSPILEAVIDCDWDVFYWSYSYNTTLQAYVLVIRTESRNEGSYTLTISASKSHYQEFTIIENFVIRKIQTTLEADPDYIPNWPLGFNVTIRVDYYDADHGGQVPFAEVAVDWNTSYYTIFYFGNGTYTLVLNTTCRGVGTHSINITLWRDHYAQRTVFVSLTLIPIPLIVDILSSSPVTTEYNSTDLVVVTVRVTDLYGRLMNDTTTTYHWLGGNGTMIFVGAGVYNVSFSAAADTGAYVVTIHANKTGYQIGIGFIMLNILPTDTILSPITSSIQVVVGETFEISVLFTTIYGTGIADANVTYLWAFNRTGALAFVGGNVYNMTLDSSGLTAGQYIVYVTAGGPNVIERTTTINVVLVLIPTELQAFPAIQEVDYGVTFTLQVYFNDTSNNLPIDGANVTYFWGSLFGQLQPSGTPGWYNVSLPTTIYPTGTYSVTLSADYEGYQYALASVAVIIRPQTTTMDLVLIQTYFASQDLFTNLTGITWTIPRGELLILYFTYTDAANNTIIGATGSYTWDYGYGVLEFENGFYIATLDLMQASPGTYSLQVQLTFQNYVSGQSPPYELIIIRVPTAIQILTDIVTVDTGVTWTLTVYYNDTYHNLPIIGGNLTVTIPELNIENTYMVDNGNGFYSFSVPPLFFEGTLHIEINALGGLQYGVTTENIVVLVSFGVMVRNSITIGLIAAVIGIIMILTWLLYTRVLAIPWLVRKMRKMSRTIGKGKTPTLSKGDASRIGTRPVLMAHVVEPAYETINIPVPVAGIPTAIVYDEREAEDEAIWAELKKLPRLDYDQKLELFQQMKRIPATERVWFLEDLKQQMTDETRFARKPKEPKFPKKLEQELQRRLATFPALSETEKNRVAKQLRQLPPEEWEEIFHTLAVSEKPEVITPELLAPDEFPSLTEEERRRVLEEIKDLSEEEQRKVLSTLREKRPEDVPKGKVVKGKKKFKVDDVDESE
ncbi:MAG: hypothetical protein ACXACF_00895 [Candidatus Hermodarchaeia archaeon]